MESQHMNKVPKAPNEPSTPRPCTMKEGLVKVLEEDTLVLVVEMDLELVVVDVGLEFVEVGLTLKEEDETMELVEIVIVALEELGLVEVPAAVAIVPSNAVARTIGTVLLPALVPTIVDPPVES
ncbi:MAG: hypothetical protein M1818_002486 [Claussenomyces sp. TS43310]|nr:MAG: hypothetical protein M1818_002486 [Claussenomyces sp. TS43310]